MPFLPYARSVDQVLERLGTNRRDAGLAALLTALGLAQVVMEPIAARGLGELFVAGTTAPLAWRRARPLVAALVSSAFWLIPVTGFPYLGFVTAILMFYGLGAYGAPLAAVAAVTAWGAAAGVVGTLLGPEPPVAAVGSVLVVVAPVAAGQAVERQRRHTATLAQLALELEQERRRVQDAAVSAERARIAQELHDVVGHELTLIAIQAEAAAAALRVAPDRAAQPVEAIRETAHRTLAEIRGTLDVLAPGRDTAAVTSAGLTDLVRRSAAAGIPATLRMTGDPWPGQATTWLAVNRIVRECITNAGRHAPGQPLEVAVHWTEEEVTVYAGNPVSGRRTRATTGLGLSGIRARAELLGGSFVVRRDDGRFEVDVALPREEAR